METINWLQRHQVMITCLPGVFPSYAKTPVAVSSGPIWVLAWKKLNPYFCSAVCRVQIEIHESVSSVFWIWWGYCGLVEVLRCTGKVLEKWAWVRYSGTFRENRFDLAKVWTWRLAKCGVKVNRTRCQKNSICILWAHPDAIQLSCGAWLGVHLRSVKEVEQAQTLG